RMTSEAEPLLERVRQALATVEDPEIHRPITELGLVRSVELADDGTGRPIAVVGNDLATAGCRLKAARPRDATRAAEAVEGIAAVRVDLGVMSAEQRKELRTMLRGTDAEPVIPFAQPGSITKVFAIASGKGGVGKSSVTANLAAAMAADGLRVGVV